MGTSRAGYRAVDKDMLSFFKFGRNAEHDVGAVSDLRAFLSQDHGVGWPVRVAAVVIPIALIGGFVLGMAGENPYIEPEVTYVRDWPTNRSVADIHAQQAIDLPVEQAQRKAERDAAEKQRAEFRKLAKAMGIDAN